MAYKVWITGSGTVTADQWWVYYGDDIIDTGGGAYGQRVTFSGEITVSKLSAFSYLYLRDVIVDNSGAAEIDPEYKITTKVATDGTGTLTANKTTAKQGVTVTLTATPATGYTLSKYTTSPSVTITNNKFTMPGSNITVKATFVKVSYKITKAVDPSGGGTITLGATTANYKDVVTASQTPSTGYSIEDFWWYKNDGSSMAVLNTIKNNKFTMPASNVIVEAVYTHVQYTITRAVSPSGTGTLTASASKAYYGNTITLTPTPATGYKLSSYTTSPTLTISSNKFTMPAKNVSVTANFVKVDYTLSQKISPSGAGSFTMKKGTTSVSTANYGDQITLAATPGTGFSFSSWTTSPSVSISSNKFTMPASNVTITANFTKINYTVTAGSYTTVSKSTANYGDVITLGYSARTGYTFTKYTVSPSTATVSGNQLTMPASNVTVTATYTHDLYTITKVVSPTGGGSFTASATSAYYADTITLAATPATGYRFVGWTTSPSVTISSNTFTMPASNITVTATFEKIVYNITKASSPSAGGTVSVKGTAVYQESVQVTQTPNNGYLFDNFTSVPSVSFSSGGVFSMPASNIAITGNYHVGRSTGTLDKSSYTVGQTAKLTIVSERSNFTHKYRLNFGVAKDTGFVNVAAGVSSVNIYIPVEWSKSMSAATISGGVLTLETYNGSTLFGTYEITGLSLSAIGGTIPDLTVNRAKENGGDKIDGEFVEYQISVPSGVSYRLKYGDQVEESPASSGFVLPGNKMKFELKESPIVTLEITKGSETFQISKSAPAVQIITKNIT